MKEGQAAIYYVTAESHAAAANSPHLEIFRKKGIEVLLLSDRIDEWVASGLTEFEGKPLTSVAKGALDLGALADSEEKAQQDKEAGEMQPLVERLAKALGEKVKEVRVTFRLTDSPACLVVGEGERLGQPRAAAEVRRAEGADRGADPRGQSAPRAGPAPDERSPTSGSASGRCCCSTRRCSRRAGTSTTPRRSCVASTR